MFKWSNLHFLFMRWIRIKHPKQAGQPELMGGFTCENEMPYVRRVERTAEESDF